MFRKWVFMTWTKWIVCDQRSSLKKTLHDVKQIFYDIHLSYHKTFSLFKNIFVKSLQNWHLMVKRLFDTSHMFTECDCHLFSLCPLGAIRHWMVFNLIVVENMDSLSKIIQIFPMSCNINSIMQFTQTGRL